MNPRDQYSFKTMLHAAKTSRGGLSWLRLHFLRWLFSWNWIECDSGIRKEITPFGIRLSVDSAIAAQAAAEFLNSPSIGLSGGAPVKITSGGPGHEYVGNVYRNGPNEDPTEEGVDIYQLNIDSSETIPDGTWQIGVRCGDVWYIQEPVWKAGSL